PRETSAAGDEITINVSYGPEQREIPDCSASLSYGECVQKLKDAGFTKFKQVNSPSTPDQKDKVLSTVPPANQTSAITNEITVVVGNGPQTAEVPVVAGQTVDVAQQILTASGFLKTLPVPTDGTEPSGQVVGTDPPNGQTVPQDTV
ncbi:PASTA domain-containing protein, partial [Mycolicibacterium gadium]|uniref:PASTA domain-containing protein n=1 Tax=Mycolicibacterium gadium TaxID=1794 RepID=UPI0021F31415